MTFIEREPLGGRTNLTGLVRPLIGRTSTLATVAAAFERGERLVTLIGPGGVGKTCLAVAHANASLETRCQEVWFCDLSGATTAADVIAIVQTTLGLTSSATTPRHEAVTRIGIALGERGPLLLLLDNFEQVASFAAETVGRWQSLARHVSFLVTSRCRLHLMAECVVEVGPLEESAAIELFEQRARAIDASFHVDARNHDAVAAIVRRLDALPLAIEMAAPWIQTLNAAELAAELGRGFEMLSLDDPCAPPRHTRLEMTALWSWEQLDAVERSVLRQIASIFHGRFSLPTAEAVLELAATDPPLVAVLRGLHERSVLRTVRGDPSPDAVLFSNYATVATVIDRIAAPLPTSTHRAAAERLVRLAELEVKRLRSAGLREALRWLERHRSDLVAVLADFGDSAPRLTASAALVLQRLASMVGPLEASLRLAQRAVDDARAAGDAILEADALRGRAEVAWIRRQLAQAEEDLARAIELIAEREAPRLAGEIWLAQVKVARDRREHTSALRHGESALRAFEVAGDLYGQALALLVSATGPAMDAGSEQARRNIERAAEIAARTSDVLLAAHIDSALATWHANRGEREASIGHHRKAVAGFTTAGDERQRTRELGFLGAALHDAGLVAEARRCIDEALDEARRLGTVAVAATLPDPAERDPAMAFARMQAVVHMLATGGDYTSDGVTAGHIGGLLLRRGELCAARRAYELGVEQVRQNPEAARPAVFFRGLAAILDLAEARFEAAEQGFAEALRWAAGLDGLAGRAAAMLLELCLDLARRGVVPAQSQDDRAVAQLLMLIERASRLSPVLAGGLMATRLALVGTLGGGGNVGPQPLRVGPDGRWFEIGEERVDLARSGPIRGILLELARNAGALGEPLSMDALFRAGWPGARVSPGVAANRVHATLNRLRVLGLRSLLVRQLDGWGLSPEVRVELVE